jgi:putative oxidoreductase
MCTDCKGHSGFSAKSAGLLLIRLAVAAVFIYHGWSKFKFMDDTIIFFGTLGLAPFFAYLVASVELLGGVLVLLGAFTCVAGVALAIVMVCSIFLVKVKMGFVAAEPDMLLLAGSLAIALMGAGRYAVMKHCPCKWCKWCKQSDSGCCGNCADCKDCKNGVCAVPQTDSAIPNKTV